MVEEGKPENSIMEFLQKTKAQIAELSKKAAIATKSGIETTTEAIQSKVVETKAVSYTHPSPRDATTSRMPSSA